MKRKWPYSMKKKIKQTRCSICGITTEELLGKTMPGIIRGMCHKDYVLFRRLKNRELVRLVRAIKDLIHATK